MNRSLLSRIYKARNTILEFIKTQDVKTDKYEKFGMNNLHAMETNDQLDMFLEGKRKIYVKFHLKNKLRGDQIFDYVDDLFHLENVLSEDDDLIIIVKDSFNDTLMETIKELYLKDRIFVRIFTLDTLQFNILNHDLVPKHVIVDNIEKIKEKFNISNNKEFPEISRFDPVAKSIGLRPGQLCEIRRNSKTAIDYSFYRFW